MKGKLLAFLIPVVYVFALLLVASPSGVFAKVKPEDVVDDHKVKICHAKTPEDAKNGYNLLDIDKSAVFKKGHDNDAADIIPEFKYFVKEDVFTGEYEYDEKDRKGECKKDFEEYGEQCRKPIYEKKDVEYTFSEKNWSVGGQIVWGLDCKLPAKCEYKTVGTYGEWSDWKGELGTLDIYRTRTYKSYDQISQDLFDEEVLCDDNEERYDACDETVAGSTITSEWEYDSDLEKEVRTITTTTLDATDDSVICSTKTVTEYNEGDTEGETDEDTDEDTDVDKPEVKGTTDVVLAETGASDTTLVYFVQMILVLGTLVSSAIFVKKYML